MFSANTTDSMAVPSPTGSFAIGTDSFHLVDQSRDEWHEKDPISNREWMVHA